MNPQPRRAAFWTTGGSVLSAVAASACCWLPLLLITFGASAVGVSAAFERLRPLFLTLAGLLLAGGFYLNYFRRPKCEPGSACEAPRRFGSRFNRITLWFGAVAVAAFALFPSYASELLGGAAPLDAHATSATLTIEGMTCAACASTLEASLQQVSGVASASVSYEERRAQVAFDPGETVPTPTLVAAVQRAGYEVADVDDPGSSRR